MSLPAFAEDYNGHLVPLGNYREEHYEKIRDFIRAHVENYFAEGGKKKADNLEEYISTQATLVLDGMYENDWINPDYIDPKTEEYSYYKESVDEYSSLYEDYDVSELLGGQ